MESKTYLKNLRESPKKLRFFLAEIKKRKPYTALDFLYYAPQKAAKIMYQALKSAISNAKNTLKVDENLLEWKLLTVEEGYKLKRNRPGGRGTPKPFKIRFSHIKIVLTAKPTEQIQKQPISVAPKIKEKKEEKRIYDVKPVKKVTKK